MFDSVIVVTDRRLLDKQLRDNIRDFSEVKNIVAPALRAPDLKAALENGKKIIITTIQKFPFIIDGIADLSDKRFAVIIDEAHSGQSGLAHNTMNQAMGGGEDPDENDPQDKILAAMQARKMRGNASYFAFTATPKNTTLEKFGVQQPDGTFTAFHLYSMKQAIEEGFILDVLTNYTTYKSYYEIQKSTEDNPLFETAKAQKKLRAYVERSQQTINTKAEVVVDHFIDNVVNTKLGHAIGLDDSEAELDPQNPNPRGKHGAEEQADPLDEIIRSFNERWFQGWSATPEEQRVKFINILESIRTHPDFSAQYGNNQDPYSRNLALDKMLKDVMLKRRKEELELYKLYASDEAFKTSWFQNIERALSEGL